MHTRSVGLACLIFVSLGTLDFVHRQVIVSPYGPVPTIPGSPFPGPGSSNVDPTSTLTWASAPATSYDIYFGTTNPPPLIATGLLIASFMPAMNNNTTYFWYVRARGPNVFIDGPVWSFTTIVTSTVALCVIPAQPPGGCGQNFNTIQAAVNAAAAGATVFLHAGTTYTESVTLPNKGVLAQNVNITSDSPGSALPTGGVRMDPVFVSALPIVQTTGFGAQAFLTAPGANHYNLRYLSFHNAHNGFGTLIQLGINDQTQVFVSQQPSFITVDQCLFQMDPVQGQSRAVEMHGANLTVSNSYFSNFLNVSESQIIWGINGTGPLTVTNNYLEGGTETFMLGGDDPQMRTILQINGTPTTTSASVTTVESGHTLSELSVGQNIVLTTANGTANQKAQIASITGTGTTGSLTWSPALTVIPDHPGRISGGVLPNNITFTKNWVRKQTSFYKGVLPQPSNLTAVPTGGGSLTPGTYCYQAQAFVTAANGPQGNQVNGAVSTEACAVLNGTNGGSVTVSWTPVDVNVDCYLLWRGPSGGENLAVDSNGSTNCNSAPTTTIDNGSLPFFSASQSGPSLWELKNMLELKEGTNVLIDSNVIENDQFTTVGNPCCAIWLKSVNQALAGNNDIGGCRWCATAFVTVSNNIVRHIPGLVDVVGFQTCDACTSPVDNPILAHDITFKNNLVYDSNDVTWGQQNGIFMILTQQGVNNLTFDHNTFVHLSGPNYGGLMTLDSSTPPLNTNMKFTNNLMRREYYGIHDSQFAECQGALNANGTPNTNFLNNGVANSTGDNSAPCPPNNQYVPPATWEAQFRNYTADGNPNGNGAADYHILPSSSFHNAATDGTDIGANIDQVLADTNGVAGMQSVITQNNLTLLGYIRVPVLASGGQNFSHGQLALRVVNGQPHFFLAHDTFSSTAFAYSPYEVVAPGTVSNSGSCTSGVGTCWSLTPSSAPIATLWQDWGLTTAATWGADNGLGNGKYGESYSTSAGTPFSMCDNQNGCGLNGSLHWHNGYLYTTWAQGFGNYTAWGDPSPITSPGGLVAITLNENCGSPPCANPLTTGYGPWMVESPAGLVSGDGLTSVGVERSWYLLELPDGTMGHGSALPGNFQQGGHASGPTLFGGGAWPTSATPGGWQNGAFQTLCKNHPCSGDKYLNYYDMATVQTNAGHSGGGHCDRWALAANQIQGFTTPNWPYVFETSQGACKAIDPHLNGGKGTWTETDFIRAALWIETTTTHGILLFLKQSQNHLIGTDLDPNGNGSGVPLTYQGHTVCHPWYETPGTPVCPPSTDKGPCDHGFCPAFTVQGQTTTTQEHVWCVVDPADALAVKAGTKVDYTVNCNNRIYPTTAFNLATNGGIAADSPDVIGGAQLSPNFATDHIFYLGLSRADFSRGANIDMIAVFQVH